MERELLHPSPNLKFLHVHHIFKIKFVLKFFWVPPTPSLLTPRLRSKLQFAHQGLFLSVCTSLSEYSIYFPLVLTQWIVELLKGANAFWQSLFEGAHLCKGETTEVGVWEMKRRLVEVLQTLPTVTPLHTWPRVTFGEVKVIVTLSEDPPRCYHAFQQAVTPE